MTPIPAAAYLRSSKDRNDVSIDAQRRELQALAAERGFLIVREYVDVVESAKSEHRPGFQELIADLRSPQRAWSALLVTDTSRLSRRVYVAHVFKHEAEKRGVRIIYSKLPEMDPITRVILESVLQAMDEVHSLMSKEKGLAGMAENVKQGFRAGGRAPIGYRLKRIPTGAIREGEAVHKTVLELSEDASRVRRFLELRVQGVPRRRAATEANLMLSPSSLVGIEWNALTYAGHTVWNVHNERDPDGGYKNSTRRRPREQWLIQHDTHPALIATADAELLIRRLEQSEMGKAISQAKSGRSDYLLTGLLVAPDGRPWIGNARRHYRLKGADGRYVPMTAVDQAVTGQILADLSSPAFIDEITRETRKRAAALLKDPTTPVRTELAGVNAQINKAMSLALQLEDPAPAIRKVDELEKRRKVLVDELARLEAEYQAQAQLAAISEDQVAAILVEQLRQIEGANNYELKGLLRAIVERIVLDPSTLECQIHYRFSAANRLSMASPRGFEPLLPP